MTSKQHVREIYPQSLLVTGSMDNYFRVIIWNDDIFGPARVIIHTDIYFSERRAWDDAWEQIQQKMLKTLEG